MSLRQSMYTGLAQPEVKMNGLSWKKSTALTSSSIFAVVSAMSAWSAECMGDADFSRVESPPTRLRRLEMALRFALISLAALLALPLDAAAQGATYRCTAKDGKKYYGSTIPRQCAGQPI